MDQSLVTSQSPDHIKHILLDTICPPPPHVPDLYKITIGLPFKFLNTLAQNNAIFDALNVKIYIYMLCMSLDSHH